MYRLQEVCAGQTFVQLFIIFNSRDQQKHCPSGTHIDEGSGPCEMLPVKSRGADGVPSAGYSAPRQGG